MTGTELPAGLILTPTRGWTSTDDSQGPSRGPSDPVRGCKGPLRTPLAWPTGLGRASARRVLDQLPTNFFDMTRPACHGLPPALAPGREVG